MGVGLGMVIWMKLGVGMCLNIGVLALGEQIIDWNASALGLHDTEVFGCGYDVGCVK